MTETAAAGSSEGGPRRRREWLSTAFQEQREQRLFCVQCWESEVEPGLRECLTVYTDCIPAMWLQDAFNLYSGNGLNSSLSPPFFYPPLPVCLFSRYAFLNISVSSAAELFMLLKICVTYFSSQVADNTIIRMIGLTAETFTTFD